MGVYDTLVIPGTEADGEQIKCWYNDMRSVRLGDEVPAIITVRLKDPEEITDPDEDYEEVFNRDYVIVLRCGGFLVVRDCKVQGYYREGELVSGDPPVEFLLRFDKWGEGWVDSRHNCGIMGEPYFDRDCEMGRLIETLARAGQ